MLSCRNASQEDALLWRNLTSPSHARSVALCSLWPPLQRIRAAHCNIMRARVMTPVQQNAGCVLYQEHTVALHPTIPLRELDEVTGRRYAVNVKVLTEVMLSQIHICRLEKNLQCKCFSKSSHTRNIVVGAQLAMRQQQEVKIFFFFFFWT